MREAVYVKNALHGMERADFSSVLYLDGFPLSRFCDLQSMMVRRLAWMAQSLSMYLRSRRVGECGDDAFAFWALEKGVSL